MSYAITPYAVQMDRLKQAIGSGDESLLKEVLEQQEDFLSDIDMIDEECKIRCSQALKGLVFADFNDEVPPYLYGYAFMALCAHLGDELPSINDISGVYDWILEVDTAQQANGVNLKLADLVYSGSPITIPDRDDFPYIGSWDSKKIQAALKDIQAGDFSAFDSDLSQTIDQIKSWLTIASRNPNASIIGFLS